MSLERGIAAPMLGRSLLSLSALLAVSACTYVGPIGEPYGMKQLARAIELQPGESIEQYARVDWVQGADGYIGIWIGQGASILSGVLTCTTHRVTFAVWDDDRYMQRLDLPYASLASVEVKSHGLGRRLVIRAKDLNAYTFEVQGMGTGFAIDQDATRVMAQCIATRITPSC